MANISEIKSRLVDLEEGPWSVDIDLTGECWIRIPHHSLNFGDMETTDECCFDVAEFIAHSREDIPFLLAENEKLRKALYFIANYGPADTVDFSWHKEWRYVRQKAREALVEVKE